MAFMDFGDIIRRIQSSGKEKVGKKLADLAPEEIACWESLNLREDEIRKKMESLGIDLEDIFVQRKKWWRSVMEKNKIDCHATIRDGALFELIVKEE